jgi:hypothetical protein
MHIRYNLGQRCACIYVSPEGDIEFAVGLACYMKDAERFALKKKMMEQKQEQQRIADAKFREQEMVRLE